MERRKRYCYKGLCRFVDKLRILIVEDNSALVANLFDYFESLGHVMDAAPDGLTGLHLATVNKYDAIILDIILPSIDGIEVCRRLRDEFKSRVPIVLLTAKGTLTDKIEGFDTGADDYVVKPVELPELERRIYALVKRFHNNLQRYNRYEYEGLVYDSDTLKVTRDGQDIKLNPICRTILEILIRNAPNVVSKEKLESSIWKDTPPDQDILRSHIYMLRNSIDKPFKKPLLKTVQRTGYRLSVDD